MKVKFILVFLLLPPLFCNAQYAWHALPAAPISWRFDDFYFVDPSMGWAINPNYDNISPNQFGRIFKTTDGGNTWQKLKDSSNTFYRSVGFADSLNGWVGNLADTTFYPSIGTRLTTDTIPLYQTHDGGITWNPANLPQPHPAGICGISVVTDSIVFAYGRWFSPAGYVKTTDRGASWVYKDMNSLAYGLVDGHFFGKDTGFITGTGPDQKAIILSTVDGGATWNYCYHSTRSDTDRVWKIYFPSRNTGYASIEYGGSVTPYNTWYLKTTDGGLTWTEHPFMTSYDEEGVGFINDSTGWIGGDILVGTYITHDGGNTWAIDAAFGAETPPYIITPGAYSINRFRSFGDTLMYASGNTIYKLNAASAGIPKTNTNKPAVSVFPNPVTDIVTVEATNIDADKITIQVTDITGGVLLQEEENNNNRNVSTSFDVKTLSAGMYFVILKTETKQYVAKVVKE